MRRFVPVFGSITRLSRRIAARFFDDTDYFGDLGFTCYKKPAKSPT
jgi:hypothetical protein